MSYQLCRKDIGKSIAFNWIEDKKFKHNRISVNMILPLSEQTATQYAILPFLMQRGYSDCSDFTAFSRKLDMLYGASVSGDVSKIGNYQIITLSIIAMDDRFALEGEDLVRSCADTLAGIVCSPAITDGKFDAEVVKIEKQSLQDTIEAEINDKRSYAAAKCIQLMFAGEPCATRKFGYVEKLADITPQSCADAYNEMLRTASIEVLMIGASASESTADIFEKAFSEIKRSPITVDLQPRTNPDIIPQEVTEVMDLSQAKMVLGFKTGAVETDMQSATSRVMTGIFGGTAFSKLFVNVREKLSLCYYCASKTNTETQYMLVECGVEAKNKDRAKEEILRQLEDVKSGNFTSEEMLNSKLAITNALRGVADSLSGLERWYLTQILEGECISPEDELKNVMAVTKDNIEGMAQAIKLSTVYLLTGDKSEEETL